MISLVGTLLLGWRPMLDPIPVDGIWMVLLIPLILVISVVYKAIKVQHLKDLPRQSALMALQILVFMVAAAAVLWLITEGL